MAARRTGPRFQRYVGASIGAEEALAQRAESAMTAHLGKTFFTIVRSVESLQQLLASDPYSRFRLAPGSKRVVTFFRVPPARKPPLPIELDQARLLAVAGGQALSAYVPTPKGPVFMTLLEKTFGKDITTRTWETVTKVAK